MASELQIDEELGDDPERQPRKSLSDELWDQEEGYNDDAYGETQGNDTDPSSSAAPAGQVGAFSRRRGYSRKMQEDNGEYEASPLGTTTKFQSDYASSVQPADDTDRSFTSEDDRPASPTQQLTGEEICSQQRKAFHAELFENLDMESRVAQIKTEMRLISAKLAYGSRDWQDMARHLDAAHKFSIESQFFPLRGRVQFYYAICLLKQEEFDDALTRFSFAKAVMEDLYDESALVEQWMEETRAAKGEYQRNKHTDSPKEQLRSVRLV